MKFMQERIERNSHRDSNEEGEEEDDDGLSSMYTVGKYDENRVHLYSSSLFQDDENMIDGYDGARTVHIGIDIGGPVGTNIHSFADGVIHSVGYNSELGDYGHVVVVEYDLSAAADIDSEWNKVPKIWALYGHLDSSTLQRNHVGKEIKKGDILGRLGDVDENGGW